MENVGLGAVGSMTETHGPLEAWSLSTAPLVLIRDTKDESNPEVTTLWYVIPSRTSKVSISTM